MIHVPRGWQKCGDPACAYGLLEVLIVSPIDLCVYQCHPVPSVSPALARAPVLGAWALGLLR